MKKSVMMALLLILGATPLFAWGPKGHDVVAAVAEAHLKPRTRHAIEQALEGRSLLYWANWMDNASHTPEYAYTLTWHYKNIDEGYTLATMPREERGDILTALECLMQGLKSGQLSSEEEAVYLRMLVHLVGDLHCPMHTGHRSDLGGNRIPLYFFGKESDLHSVWDSSLVEAAHRWSHSEWQEQIDRLKRREAKALAEGSFEEWFEESHALCQKIYRELPEGSRISYNEVARYAPIIEEQLLRGGVRLARLLNEIYR